MNLSENDYRKLYNLQDKVFRALSGHYGALYLTGGTALGRFYLNHRYSEDIDFFTNADTSFKSSVTAIRNILELQFSSGRGMPVLYQDFVRIWIDHNTAQLKIEFVNDVPSRWGGIHYVRDIPIDNPGNILANKLSALVSRDEPKDVFDIIHLSTTYSFNWAEVFEQSIKKAIVAEQDIAMRLSSFPVEWLENTPWLFHQMDKKDMKAKLETIADDFLFAKDNSLGKGKTHILDALPFCE